ncbi:MAG: hypothetical protein COW08_00050, partial [Ignavibacteriales bacterium CG12_big_fil_rev_8_21_14_0_65_30_8]
YLNGSKKIFNKLIKSINNKIDKTDTKQVKKEMKSMRKKMYPISYSTSNSVTDIKLSPGGLSDIDFIVQYFILSKKIGYKKCKGNSITKILDQLIKIRNNNKQLTELKKNYNFLKNTVLANQNISNSRTYKLSDNILDKTLLNTFINLEGEMTTDEKISKIFKFNLLMFNKTFN